MTLATAHLLVGRTIVAADLRPFSDGRGGKAYRPVLTLDNGATVEFTVQETDAHGDLDGLPFHDPSDPGVRPEYTPGKSGGGRVYLVKLATRPLRAAVEALSARIASDLGDKVELMLMRQSGYGPDDYGAAHRALTRALHGES